MIAENNPEMQEKMIALNEKITEIRNEIGKVIIGQHSFINLLIVSLLCDGHVLIEGAPGVAKTLAAKLMAKIVDANFSRIQFTPDLMPSDVIGTSVFDPKLTTFTFRRGPVFSNIILIDEINRAPAKTQAALFEVMEERQITVDGTTHEMEFPFNVFATQNPIEQEGTYRLPEAQLDRFLFKAEVPYPTLQEEIQILKIQQGKSQAELLQDIKPLISVVTLRQMREWVEQVRIEDRLVDYVAGIVNETRNNPALYMGASTRASVGILKSSKVMAAMSGRDFVIPEDIIAMVPHVLRHRIILTPEKEMSGFSAEDMIQSILKSIEIPR